MALLPYTKLLVASSISKTVSRTLVSKQLVYTEFGDPLHVVKFRECVVPPLGSQEVLVRMLAAPVNPADINTIQGRNLLLPCLPTVPGDEGVGEVVEIGSKVCAVSPGNRVVLFCRMLGTWRYYGIYHERALYVVSKLLPLPEAAMLTIAPCIAYRMLKDFRDLHPGETVIQNAANSPVGQSVIQLCSNWGLKTVNIVASHCGYDTIKEYLMNLGATKVCTLEEAEELTKFDTSLSRPVLALNCLGGRYEDVLLKLLERCGSIVYYGCAFDLPMAKQFLRSDAKFFKFHYGDWSNTADPVEVTRMLSRLIELMVIKRLRAPMHTPIELKDYVCAFRDTVYCEAFATKNYLFDFTLP